MGKNYNSGLRHFMFHQACFQTCLTKTFYRTRKKKREKFKKPNTRKGKRTFRCSVYMPTKSSTYAHPHQFTSHQCWLSECEKQGRKTSSFGQEKNNLQPILLSEKLAQDRHRGRDLRKHAHHYPSTIAGDVKRAIAMREVRIPPSPIPCSWHLLYAQTSA